MTCPLPCHAVFQAERDANKFAIFVKKSALDARAQELKSKLTGTLLSSFREESKARAAVLKRLGHITDDNVVLLKGRAACELDTADELLATGEG
eukprot:jgi/Chrzof1/7606/Cz02g30010.t1